MCVRAPLLTKTAPGKNLLFWFEIKRKTVTAESDVRFGEGLEHLDFLSDIIIYSNNRAN